MLYKCFVVFPDGGEPRITDTYATAVPISHDFNNCACARGVSTKRVKIRKSVKAMGVIVCPRNG